VSDKSLIEWTEATWNPITGCTEVSPGCDHCYAKRFAERFRGVPGHPYEQGFDLRFWPDRLDLPLRWRRPRMVFVNSMSDLFLPEVLTHTDDVPCPFLARVFARMVAADRRGHTFQVLTKRPGIMARVLRSVYFKLDVNTELLRLGHRVMPGGMSEPETPWPAHIWLGTSVESPAYYARIRCLQDTPAALRFLSLEPLLAAMPDLPLGGIALVEVGRRCAEALPRRFRREILS
jgi:protein gp37